MSRVGLCRFVINKNGWIFIRSGDICEWKMAEFWETNQTSIRPITVRVATDTWTIQNWRWRSLELIANIKEIRWKLVNYDCCIFVVRRGELVTWSHRVDGFNWRWRRPKFQLSFIISLRPPFYRFYLSFSLFFQSLFSLSLSLCFSVSLSSLFLPFIRILEHRWASLSPVRHQWLTGVFPSDLFPPDHP